MNVFDTENKIKNNLEQLEFYYNSNDRLRDKFSFFVVIYSFIFIYLIELFKYFLEIKLNYYDVCYLILFICFIFFFIKSLILSYRFIKPVDIFYMHEPKYFYTDILNQYKVALNSDDDELLNEYVNTTYLLEAEDALNKNIETYKTKGDLFYFNFKAILYSLVFYILSSSFVIFEKRNQKNSFEILNYKEIVNYINKSIMANKPKVDDKLVIRTNPVAVKQGSDKGKILKESSNGHVKKGPSKSDKSK